MIKCILLDIGGTISSESHIRDRFYPYAYEQMESFIKKNKEQTKVQAILTELSAEMESGLSLKAASNVFREWINKKIDHHLLMRALILIWIEGMNCGDLKNHIYEEVPDKLRQWKEQGIELAVFSSAPKEVQSMLLKHSTEGDLSEIFSHHFDLENGSKEESSTFSEICLILKVDPNQILFLSDRLEEVNAARKTGLQVNHIVRGEASKDEASSISSFDEIHIP